MTLKKAIKHNKEFREEYRGPARISVRCRHGGGCAICSGNRQFVGNKLKLASAQDLLEELEDDRKSSNLSAYRRSAVDAEDLEYEEFADNVNSMIRP